MAGRAGDLIQMLAYMRVCIYLWSCAVSIYYGRFVMTSCHIWQCPLSAHCPLYNRFVYTISLYSWRFWCVFVCFFVALNVPPPYFPAGVSRLVTPLSPAQKFLIWGKEKEPFQTCEKISIFIMLQFYL